MKYVVNVVLNDFVNDTRVSKISKSLVSQGRQLKVVAMHNDGLEEKESVCGVEVDRIKLRTRSWPKARPVQVLKYFEFFFRSFLRYRKFDIVHCNDLNTLPIGALIKLCGKNIKLVYDCHEYETEIDALGAFEKKVRKLMERALIHYADQVITVSDSIANEYSLIYNIEKPALVLNCPPYREVEKKNIFRESLGIRDDQNIFLYQGGMKSGRGIKLLLESFAGLDDDRNILVCMGYGPLEGLVKDAARQNPNVFFHPAVKSADLLDYTSSGDYGVLFYEDTCLNHRYCSPNKIFEYLMAGLPVLSSNLFEMKRLVESEGIGIVAKDNSVHGFRKAVRASLDQDYNSIQENVFSARKKYCWEYQEKKLLSVYGKL